MRAAGWTTGVHTWRRACVCACRSECVCVAASLSELHPLSPSSAGQAEAAASARFVHLNGRPPPSASVLSLSVSPHSWQSYFLRYATAREGKRQRPPSLSPSLGRSRSLAPLLPLMDLMMNRAELSPAEFPTCV